MQNDRGILVKHPIIAIKLSGCSDVSTKGLLAERGGGTNKDQRNEDLA